MMNIDFMFNIADTFEAIANLALVAVVYQMIRSNMYKTVQLSIGSFKMKAKDFNVQNVTNVVSLRYYNGGQIPAEVRAEIIRVTLPKIKG